MENFSGIAGVAVFGQEKFLQQAVHLEQAFAVQQDGVALDGEKTPVTQRLQRRSETFGGIDAELLFEIGAADVAELELQNEFADVTLVRAGRERAIDRQL